MTGQFALNSFGCWNHKAFMDFVHMKYKILFGRVNFVTLLAGKGQFFLVFNNSFVNLVNMIHEEAFGNVTFVTLIARKWEHPIVI